jgi:hypothetical protein
VPGSHAPGIFDVTGVNSQWGDMAPFALHSVDQYVGGGPYSLTSAEYAADFNEVKSLGRATSITRTADQTHAALWWMENSNFTWNRIARIAAAAHGNSLNENARLFALLNLAAADAIITGFRAKYTYLFWRPIKAIARADEDNNSATDADPTWVPLALTPAHPDYVSNHGIYSAAAAQVLADFFGDDFSFSTGSSSAVPAGSTRTFGSFSAAAAECGESRIWLGYHTRKAVEDGLKSGRQIGHFTFEHIARMKTAMTSNGPYSEFNDTRRLSIWISPRAHNSTCRAAKVHEESNASFRLTTSSSKHIQLKSLDEAVFMSRAASYMTVVTR